MKKKKFPGLHPLGNLVLGICSIPVILLVLSYYFSLEIVYSLLIGVIIGLLADLLWFTWLKHNFKFYVKFLKNHKKYFTKYCRRCWSRFLFYLITILIAMFIFFE